MDKILTAFELMEQRDPNGEQMSFDFCEKMMLEFAKLHVQAALEAAAEKADIEGDESEDIVFAGVDKSSILNAYPLENIK